MPVGRTLAETLRDDLGLTGTKIACGEGHCGACTVQLDGVPVLSCITLVHTVGDREVTTIEGLRDHPLVEAFVRADALQCGYCTPGPDRLRGRARDREPAAVPGGDPPRDGRQPLPLRGVPPDRGGGGDVARLIRTEKEVEGRYEEVWTVVDEDALEQWPAGPLAVVGRGATRIDGYERARGQARYTADVRLPGMLHTAVLRSPFARACARAIDVTGALAIPGVRLAVGPEDMEELTAEPGYHGAPVAAVCADTLEQARAALEAIAVDWEPMEALLDAERAIAAGSLIDQDRHERGDIEHGLAQANAVVEATYRTQVVLHNSLETHVSVCEWHGDAVTAYVSTQWIWGVRRDLAAALELPEEQVRVVCEVMGGGFGSKVDETHQTVLTARLARLAGRPVKWQLSRREEHLDAGNRNATVQRLRLGADADGTLTAIDGDYVVPIGYDGWLASPAGPAQVLYACDHVRTRTRGAKVNTPPMSAFRAPGFVEGTFALECALDELAAALGVDPLEIRRRNYATVDPQDGTPFSDKRLDRAYELAEKHWERRHEVRARSDERWRRGVGLASQIWYGGGGPPSHAWLRLGSDGRAHVVTAMQDIGTGTRTTMAMIAAEELGLPLERVTVRLGDTSGGPYATQSRRLVDDALARPGSARRGRGRAGASCSSSPPSASASSSPRSRSRAAGSWARSGSRGRSRRSPACSSRRS